MSGWLPEAQLPTLKIHPVTKELSEWLPVLAAKEREQLKESIIAHGIEVPVLVNRAMDMLIDGVNRWRIAHELGLKVKDVPLEVFEGDDEEIPDLILRRNVLRRHLTDDQRAALVSKVRGPQLEKEAAERMKTGGGDRSPKSGEGRRKGKVTEQIAQEAGTSRYKAEQAEKARKAGLIDDVIRKKRKLSDTAKAKGKSKRKPKATRSFEDEVWARWSKWLKYWPQTQHRDVIKHVLAFIKDRTPVTKGAR
jgi:hypothetical protein